MSWSMPIYDSSISREKKSACICAGDWTTIDTGRGCSAVSASSLWEEIYTFPLPPLRSNWLLYFSTTGTPEIFSAECSTCILDKERNLPEISSHPGFELSFYRGKTSSNCHSGIESITGYPGINGKLIQVGRSRRCSFKNVSGIQSCLQAVELMNPQDIEATQNIQNNHSLIIHFPFVLSQRCCFRKRKRNYTRTLEKTLSGFLVA